jgi:hypothetical protein
MGLLQDGAGNYKGLAAPGGKSARLAGSPMVCCLAYFELVTPSLPDEVGASSLPLDQMRATVPHRPRRPRLTG